MSRGEQSGTSDGRGRVAVFDTIILLAEANERNALAGLMREHNSSAAILTPEDTAALAAIPAATLARARLIGFLTPVIVPASILAALGYGAYNFHPGPPNYPGWLPSHFAIEDGAGFFGATAHEMAASVDSGPIVDLEMFGVPHGTGVAELERLAFIECVRLVWRLAPALAADPGPRPAMPVKWSGRRGTKARLAALGERPAPADNGAAPAIPRGTEAA